MPHSLPVSASTEITIKVYARGTYITPGASDDPGDYCEDIIVEDIVALVPTFSLSQHKFITQEVSLLKNANPEEVNLRTVLRNLAEAYDEDLQSALRGDAEQ